MKKENGITIVSLVVTIIVLIILAGVSLTSILGENGIITIAKQAKENVELSKTEEQTKLNELYRQITIEETNLGSNTGSVSDAQLEELLTKISSLEEGLNQQKQEIAQLRNETKTIDDIYPVGSIYITTDIYSAEEMSNKFGGTWQSYAQGRTIIGVGTGTDENSKQQAFTANQIGGEYKHILTVAEMPKHSHTNLYYDGTGSLGWGYNYTANDRGTRSAATESSGGIGETGGSQEHNNIQPYIATYIWKRVS